MFSILRRDSTGFGDETGYGAPMFLFVPLLLFILACIGALIYFQRRRRAAARSAILPTHHKGHHRTLTITTHPAAARGDSIFVYDEKMNLIANSSSPPDSPIPEIHVTFPEEIEHTGEKKAGRVVVLRISETGSVGMEPLQAEPLPPYQTSKADRFQSLDLERMGGLKEKSSSTPPPQRWS